MEDFEDPFSIFASTEAPSDDEVRTEQPAFTETRDADGNIQIKVFPTQYARQFAAAMAGTFRALQDTNEFDRAEAMQVLLQSMSAVVIHSHDEDDDDDD